RVEKNSLKQQLDEVLGKNSELTDKVAEVEKAHSAAQQELLKLRVALDAGVPGEHVRMVAERLQGTTEEELKADAAKLVQTFKLDQSRHLPIDPSQGRGRDQNSGPIDNSPQAQFAYMWHELLSKNRRRSQWPTSTRFRLLTRPLTRTGVRTTRSTRRCRGVLLTFRLTAFPRRWSGT